METFLSHHHDHVFLFPSLHQHNICTTTWLFHPSPHAGQATDRYPPPHLSPPPLPSPHRQKSKPMAVPVTFPLSSSLPVRATEDKLLDWIILIIVLYVFHSLRNEKKGIAQSQRHAHSRTPSVPTNIDAPFFHVKAVRYVPFLDGKTELDIPVLEGPMDYETCMDVVDALQGALQEIERQNIRLGAVERELKVLKERQLWRDEEAEWEDYDELDYDDDYDDDYDEEGEEEFADDEGLEDDESSEDDNETVRGEVERSIIYFDGKAFDKESLHHPTPLEIKAIANTRVTKVTSAYVYCN